MEVNVDRSMGNARFFPPRVVMEMGASGAYIARLQNPKKNMDGETRDKFFSNRTTNYSSSIYCKNGETPCHIGSLCNFYFELQIFVGLASKDGYISSRTCFSG